MTARDDTYQTGETSGATRQGNAFASTLDALSEPDAPWLTDNGGFERSETRSWSTPHLTAVWALWGLSTVLSVACFALFFGEIHVAGAAAPGTEAQVGGNAFLEVLLAFVRWEHFLDMRPLLMFVFFMGVSVFVAWSRRRDAMAVLFATVSACIAVAPINGYLIWGAPEMLHASSWRGATLLSYTLMLSGGFGLIALFPNGRVVPGLRWLIIPLWAAGTLIVGLSWWLLPAPTKSVLAATGLLGTLIIATAIWRYFHHANTMERLQLKWFLLAISAFVLIQLPTIFMVHPFISSDSTPVAVLATLSFEALLLTSVVLMFTLFMIGVVRHKLWNVDVVINRSLVYGGLFLALLFVLVFAFVVFGLGFQALLGDQGVLWALLLGAVLAALSFKPLLTRLKRFVDRRFYGIRVNYDAMARARNTRDTPAPSTAITGPDPQSTFGDYSELSSIGKGGMGHIYRAVHTATGDIVALKVLREHLCGGGESERRFFREAEIASRLSHPGIIHMRDKGVLEDVPYLAMDLVEGTDLASLLRRRKKLPLAETLPILQGVAAALDYAHKEGIVHRDVKPSNILLTMSDHRPVLTDFGIARFDQATTRLTRQGAVLGTLDYISPEQIHGEVDISGHADIYALGVTAFEMFTGERPFSETRAVRLAMAHLMRPPPDPRTLVPDLPRTIARALGRALQKQPLDRFATPGEFVEALSGAENQAGE